MLTLLRSLIKAKLLNELAAVGYAPVEAANVQTHACGITQTTLRDVTAAQLTQQPQAVVHVALELRAFLNELIKLLVELVFARLLLVA